MNAQNRKRLDKLNQHSTFSALVLTLAILMAVVGLGLQSVYAETNGGYVPDDLTVKQGENKGWYTYEKESGKQVLNYTGIVSNEHGWWRIENGTVNFNATGVYHNEYGYWYVRKGKVQFTFNGFLQANYVVDKVNGSPLYSDDAGNTLKSPVESAGTNVKAVSTKKCFWRFKNGKVQVGYTGAKKTTINGVNGWWRVETGRIVPNFNGIASNEYGWWYFKNGRIDFDYTGVARNELGWWRIEGGKVNFQYNGIASNEYGSWYIVDGKVDFNYSGAFVLDHTMYVVKRGKVISSEKLTVSKNGVVTPTVTFTNSSAKLSWKAIQSWNGAPADSYEIYVKMKPTDRYTKVGTVDGKTTSFSHSFGSYIDPTKNPRIYDVRAIQKNKYGIVVASSPENKQTAANGYVGGSFAIAAPDLISLTEKGENYELRFLTVPYVTQYDVYYGLYDANGGVSQLRKAESVKAKSSGSGSAQDASAGYTQTEQTVTVKKQTGFDFITVQAIYTSRAANGYQTVEMKSAYDTGFRLERASLSGQKVLFLGDSLMIGTPYGPTTLNYTISNRVAQQTGAKVYNAAVGGAVVVSDYPRVINNSILHNQTMLLADGTHENYTNGKWQGVSSLPDFDIVVFEGGPNDWDCRVPLGDLSSTSVSTFYGALNQHMSILKEASQARVAAGKAPLKVVIYDMIYSPKGSNKNLIGLTYNDYSKALRNVTKAYEKDPDIQVFFYETHKEVLNQGNAETETIDLVHMTAYRYGQMGNHLARYLESLPDYVPAETSEMKQKAESVSTP